MRTRKVIAVFLVTTAVVGGLSFHAVGSDLLPAPRIPDDKDGKPASSSGFGDIPVQKKVVVKNSANPDKISLVDQDLESWMNQWQKVVNPMELRGEELQKFIAGLDEVSRRLVVLRHLDSDIKEKEKIVLTTLEELGKNSVEVPLKKDPLYPYLVDELIDNQKINKSDADRAWQFLRQEGGNSCPTRSLMLRDLEIDARGRSLEDTRVLLSRIKRYKSRRFRELVFESFLSNLPVEQQGPLKEEMLKLVASYPKIMEDNEWLSGIKSIKENDERQIAKLPEPQKSLELARKASLRRLCNTSRSYFLDALKRDKSHKSFEEVESTAIKVETCFRTRSHQARLKFWQDMEKPLHSSYGFPGLEMAMRRRGLILWGTDAFEEARVIFKKILDEVEKGSYPDIEARALFTFAKIEENEGKFDSAITYFKKYNDKYPDKEEIENVRISLILLDSMVDKPKDALTLIEKMVSEESKLPIDKRSPNALPFAMFWGGRIYLSMGEVEKAKNIWMRVAQEYYSTYYGALGQFMVEKIGGKAIPLPPQQVASFDEKKLESALDEDGRSTYARVKGLLALGMKNDSRCEIKELDDSENDSTKALLKSMLLYVSGEWVEAVKIYSNLPRSFRDTLPHGMERILFPRAYEGFVGDYSRKLELDPDIIFAIIRQESVFNPRAKSPVGARGLMQLMPQTARLEAKSLRQDYLSSDQRLTLQRQSLEEKSLEEADVNVALGVHHVHRLLERYKSPVFVLTAYNASPKATERWLKTIGTDDILAFIERIPYRETKAYVKLVMRNYFYYKRWYGDPKEKLTHLESLITKIFASHQVHPGNGPSNAPTPPPTEPGKKIGGT